MSEANLIDLTERATHWEAGPLPSVEPHELQRAVAAFPTGVTVVTTTDRQGNPVGFTSNAFASVSLDPPSVGVFVAATSRTLASLRHSDFFAVNFLNDGAEHIARLFASRAADKFDGVEWRTGVAGTPVLHTSALAIVECEKYSLTRAGDHYLLLGRVVSTIRKQDEAPVLYYERQYLSIPDTRTASRVGA